MNILILDPALSTGVCLMSIVDDIAHITYCDYLDIEEDLHKGKQYSNYLEAIKKIIVSNNIDFVAHESYFFSKFASQGADLNCSNRAMIQLACATAYPDKMIPYDVISISLWKKFICGRTTATTELKKQFGKESSKKIMTQIALYEKYGIRFPNHSISANTGKPIKFRYDIVDVVAMAIFTAKITFNVSKISYEVKCLPDIIFKKKPSGLDYDTYFKQSVKTDK